MGLGVDFLSGRIKLKECPKKIYFFEISFFWKGFQRQIPLIGRNLNQKEQATDLLFLIRLLKNDNNHKLNLLSRLLLF